MQLRRAAIAAAIGSAIEWYDFFLYGVAAALVFPTLFFPQADPMTGVLAAFSTYFVGFLARPIGAAIFGHFGDRVGRKATLVATLLMMGLSTVAIGLVPTHAAIGVWGGVLLVALRAFQGIGVGGEWGGAVLLAMEWAPPEKRGLAAAWPQMGVAAGLVLANGAVALCTWLAGDAFMAWGWRLPFFFSIGLVAVGLWIRLGILETPDFAAVKARGEVAAAPVGEVLTKHGGVVLLTALARSGQQTPFYVFTTFVLVYGTKVLGLPQAEVLNWVLLGSCAMMFTVPFWAAVSDRFGRKRLVLAGAVAMIPFSFAYFAMLDSGVGWLVALAIVVALPVHDVQYGPQAAFIAECFPPRLRYSGASLGYQLASIVSGGPAAMIALWLFETTRSSASVAAYMAVSAAVGVAATAMLPDRVCEET